MPPANWPGVLSRTIRVWVWVCAWAPDAQSDAAINNDKTNRFNKIGILPLIFCSPLYLLYHLYMSRIKRNLWEASLQGEVQAIVLQFVSRYCIGID